MLLEEIYSLVLKSQDKVQQNREVKKLNSTKSLSLLFQQAAKIPHHSTLSRSISHHILKDQKFLTAFTVSFWTSSHLFDTFNLNQITDSYWSLQVFLALGLDWFPHLVLSQYLLKIHSFLILFFLLARFIHLNILMSFLDKLQYVPWKMTFIKSLLFPLLVYRGKNGREKRWLGTAFMFSTFVFLRGEETLKICPLSFLVRGGENTRGGKIKKRTEEFCVQAH